MIATKATCDKAKLTHLSIVLSGDSLQAIRPMLTDFKPNSYAKVCDLLYERYCESFLVM